MPALIMRKKRTRKEGITFQIESEMRDFLDSYKEENDLYSLGEAAREVLRLGQMSVALDER